METVFLGGRLIVGMDDDEGGLDTDRCPLRPRLGQVKGWMGGETQNTRTQRHTRRHRDRIG